VSYSRTRTHSGKNKRGRTTTTNKEKEKSTPLQTPNLILIPIRNIFILKKLILIL
jgi:hypothetical protein